MSKIIMDHWGIPDEKGCTLASLQHICICVHIQYCLCLHDAMWRELCVCVHTHTHSYLQLHRTYWITIDRMYSYVNIYKYMHIQSRSIIHNNIQSHPYHIHKYISWSILFHYIYTVYISYITWTPQHPSNAVTLPPRTWLERCYRRNRCHPAENPPVKRPKREWLRTRSLSWSVDLSRKLCVFQTSQTSLGVLKYCWKYAESIWRLEVRPQWWPVWMRIRSSWPQCFQWDLFSESNIAWEVLLQWEYVLKWIRL